MNMPDLSAPDLSIIVPVLNEAKHLPRLLLALSQQTDITLEIIVVDGGSDDASVELALAQPGAQPGVQVVRTSPGRGQQMNAGAELASADWLLFLHADTLPRYATQLRGALASLQASKNLKVAGHFALEFQREQNENNLLYRYMQEKTASNRRYTINGDQGLLIARTWFAELGGFDTRMAFLEDQKIAAKVHERGRWQCLPGTLLTSARRFETEGVRSRYLLMAIIMTAYAIELQAFFERAPRLYQTQGSTGRLLLTPYFRCLGACMRELGWREGLARWGRVGHFIVRQSWQLFFFIDVVLRPWLGKGRYPATRLHDRLIAPCIHNRVGDWVLSVLAFIYGMVLLRGYYRWRERRDLSGLPE